MMSSESCQALLLSLLVTVTNSERRREMQRHTDELCWPYWQMLGIHCAPRPALGLDIQGDCNSVLPARDSRSTAPVVPLAEALSKNPEEPHYSRSANHTDLSTIQIVSGDRRLCVGFQRERKGNLYSVMSETHPSLPEMGSLNTCIVSPRVGDLSRRGSQRDELLFARRSSIQSYKKAR